MIFMGHSNRTNKKRLTGILPSCSLVDLSGDPPIAERKRRQPCMSVRIKSNKFCEKISEYEPKMDFSSFHIRLQ